MINDPKGRSVGQVFSTENSDRYIIPKYQREYVWNKKSAEKLISDIYQNEEGYFLGSYIVVNRDSLDRKFELIDGQQRFITLSLLYAYIYAKLYELKDEFDDMEQTNDLMLIKRRIAVKKDSSDKTYESRLRLQKQNHNNEDYQYYLSQAKIIDGIHTSRYAGNRKLGLVYKHISKVVEEIIAERLEDDKKTTRVDELFALVNKISAAKLIAVEAQNNKNAYMLFEALNHRGEPLSAIDLMKNTLIMHADDGSDSLDNENHTDEVYGKWQNILGYLGEDDYATQERFFRQYYNAFNEEIKETFAINDKDYIKVAKQSNFLSLYETLIVKDYETIIGDLEEKAKLYSILINKGEKKSYKNSLESLERIQGAPSYILLLYILSKKDDLELNDDSIDEIINLLIIFFVKRNVTDNPNTRKLIQLFMDIVDLIKNEKGEQIVPIIKKKLIDISSDEDTFRKQLSGNMYLDNQNATRFILCWFAEKNRNKEHMTDLWSRDEKNGKLIWTIEHIFPQGDEIPDCWVKMIADGNKEKAQEYLATYTHTLGNLTITGYNSELSNESYEIKRDREIDGDPVGYRNGLSLNESVLYEIDETKKDGEVVSREINKEKEIEKWTVDIIQKRTDYLVEKVIDLFKWPEDETEE